jgi:hypothetical protein
VKPPRLWSLEEVIRYAGLKLYTLLDVLDQRAKVAAAMTSPLMGRSRTGTL